MELAKHLSQKKNLTIIVNDISIALLLEEITDASIILLSGFLRRGFHSTVGPWASSTLETLNADIAFLSTNAFSVSRGFMTPDIHQAEVKKAYIQCAAHSVILFDSSKAGTFSFVIFASLEDIDTLITDSDISDYVKSSLNEYGNRLDVIYV